MQTSSARQINTRPVRNLDRQYAVLKGTKKANRVAAIKSILFIAAALMILSLSVTYYVALKSDITNRVNNIATLESKLNKIKLDNDENYSRITSNVNLEEVRRVAIQELGMQYADEGQIISFNSEGTDYVRQTGAIPD